MNAIETIKALDGLPGTKRDAEGSHIDADHLLLLFLQDHDPACREVAEAFVRARERCGFWYA